MPLVHPPATFPIDFDAPVGVAPIAGEPHIFHCNHYNTFLQRTILDPDYIDCRDVLADAATEVAYPQLIRLFERRGADSVAERRRVAEDLFRFCGFGVLDLSAIEEGGGRATSPMSHYSLAWKNKYGSADEPMAFFDAGYVAAAAAAIFDRPAGHYVALQTHGLAVGGSGNHYEVRATPGRAIADSVSDVSGLPPAPPRSSDTPVDEDAIVAALSGMEIVGNEEGLVPAFGVLLTRMYANYYNRISYEFSRRLEEVTGEPDLGSLLLIEAGHNCAFNTFGGIMQSDEWYGLIEPMCESREDWLHGIVACINAFGWGIWRVAELVPGERLVLRVYNGYEANGYLAMYGTSTHPVSYLATGGTAGLMNLLYHCDITERPDLTPSYYQERFSAPGSFSAVQTRCRAMGDDYDEFVAERDA